MKKGVQTHIAFNQTYDDSHRNDDIDDGGFALSPVRPESFNFHVQDKPVSLIAWGLGQCDSVAVYRARVGYAGRKTWSASCCGLPVAPDSAVNIAKMPYVRCGSPVVLTAENPHFVIRDSGVFFLVYSGGNDVFVELLPDAISSECCCKG